MSLNKLNLNKPLEVKLPSIMSVSINVFIGSVIGYLGPFGSYEMPLLSRLLYWIILVGSGHLIYFNVGRFFDWLVSERTVYPALKFVLPSLVAAVIFSFVVVFVSGFFFTHFSGFYQNFLFFFPKVFILGLILNIVGNMIDKFRDLSTLETKEVTKTLQPSKDKNNNFLRRLPKKIGTELICFSMEDHYLHVHTENGNHMMLLRMKDALVELEDYPGFQVHRSWWVATDAIVEVKKENRKATLIMKNEMTVPVSHKYLSVLKEVGLV